MTTEYERIKTNNVTVEEWIRSNCADQLALVDQMMDLYLYPLNLMTPKWHYNEPKTLTMALLARIFNDLEAGKHLLLKGLATQSLLNIRSALEAVLLVRYFEYEPEKSEAWAENLEHVGPGSAKTELERRGEETPEYDMYGFLSEITHANFLGVVSLGRDEELADGGLIRIIGYGGKAQPEEVDRTFSFLLAAGTLIIRYSLAPIYFSYSSELGPWLKALNELISQVNMMVGNIDTAETPKDIPGGEAVKSRLQNYLDKIESRITDTR